MLAKPKLQIIRGEVYTTSLDISERFEVPHKNVLRAIENCLTRLKSEPSNADFANTEFIETTYQDARNSARKMYLLTEEGFAMSLFLFRTEKAMEWQIKYIRAFKWMKAELLNKEIQRIKFRYADEAILPFGVEIYRPSWTTAFAAEYIYYKGWLPMTSARLTKLVKDGVIEGKFIPRKSIVYVDALMKYLNSLGIFPNSKELGGGDDND